MTAKSAKPRGLPGTLVASGASTRVPTLEEALRLLAAGSPDGDDEGSEHLRIAAENFELTPSSRYAFRGLLSADREAAEILARVQLWEAPLAAFRATVGLKAAHVALRRKVEARRVLPQAVRGGRPYVAFVPVALNRMAAAQTLPSHLLGLSHLAAAALVAQQGRVLADLQEVLLVRTKRLLWLLDARPSMALALDLEPEITPTGASLELSRATERLRSRGVGAERTSLQVEANRGEQARQQWISDGLVVPSSVLAKAWGRTRQALDQAVRRGELFSIGIRNRNWYLAVFQALVAADVAKVCRELRHLSEAEQLVFWLRPHGALGGATVEQAFRSSRVADALALAKAYAEALSASSLPTRPPHDPQP